MKISQKVVLVAALGATFAAPTWAQTATAPPHNEQAAVKGTDADNTGLNQRDRNDKTTLPTDQSNAKADIKLAAAVRHAIVEDKSLSVSAHNVKLVANAGVVTLRGPVASEAEKLKVGEIAGSVNGVSRVDNNLDIQVAKNNKE